MEKLKEMRTLPQFESLPDGGKDFDWNLYAEECFGGHWPSNASDWLESVDKIAPRTRKMLSIQIVIYLKLI